ncbi:hypothetical protein RMCBS344292_11769 [Rhizopus microsporus]|nr:hypothetical protein RMCBS344292_11769 [Rhizopus microsporus]
MFRKAKKLSQRLGLKKENCTNQERKREENLPSILKSENSSMTGSTTASLESTSSQSSTNESTEIKMIRPSLPKSYTTPTCPPTERKERRSIAADTNDLELLLSMETQARLDALAEREKQKKQDDAVPFSRPTTIKFELPVTPPRSRSPNQRLTYPRARPTRSLPEEGLTANAKRKKRSSWRYLFGDRSDDDEEVTPYVTMDARVRLKLRPLPTFGYVRFIGGVEFGKGEWVGVELDHGVGNCDGSVNGHRYFTTDPRRGIFCKRHDLEAVAE